jgi:hypothetical protein
VIRSVCISRAGSRSFPSTPNSNHGTDVSSSG